MYYYNILGFILMFNCEMARQYFCIKNVEWCNYDITVKLLFVTVIYNTVERTTTAGLEYGGIIPLGVVNGAMRVSMSFLWNAWELRILRTVMCATSCLVQSHGLRARNNDLNSLTGSGVINTWWRLCTKINNLLYAFLSRYRSLPIHMWESNPRGYANRTGDGI